MVSEEALLEAPPVESSFFIVEQVEEKERIDRFLAKKFPEKSRSYFQYLMEIGAVFLNGVPARKREIIQEGDEVEVLFEKTPTFSLKPEKIPLDILYEDEHFLAVNKPFSMVVHPAPGNWSHTFVHALLGHCEEIPFGKEELRPGIVHRLDKDTSGILLAAKTERAHQNLIEAFRNREIEKTYLAICIGRPVNGLIKQPIKRDPVHRKKMRVSEEGKPSETLCHVLAYNDQISLVRLKPLSGRTHQIRVHMQFVKTPILGDSEYGNISLNKAMKVKRQCLHAYQIKLKHPITKEPLFFTATIPEDIKKWIYHLSS